MRAFWYLAYTHEGKRCRGTVMAEDAADASRKLRQDKLHPERIEAADTRAKGIGSLRARRLDADMQVVFARQVAVLLAAELPIDAVLEIIRTSDGPGAIEQVATRVQTLLMNGLPLSDALERGNSGFPPFIISAVRAGEASRDIATVFDTIATHLEERRTERAALATALIYPGFVAAVSCLVCAALMLTVAPEIANMFAATGQPLPTLTAVMLAAMQWMADHIVALLIGAGCVVLAGVALFRQPWVKDLWQDAMLRLPIVGKLMRLDAAAQYLRTLSLVIASRQPVPDAVENATHVLRVARFREESHAAGLAIRSGSTLSSALSHTSFVPPVARQLVETGEKSARLASMTERAAVLMENWLSNDRKRLSAILDPLLMMIVGGFVLVVVLALLLPIFDLQSSLSP